MNGASCSLAPQLTSWAAVRQFLRIALSQASGALIAASALLGSIRVVPILLSSWISGDEGPQLHALYRLIPSEIEAACMLIGVLIAEQCVRQGVRRLIAYVPAVIIAAMASGLIAMPLIVLEHDPEFAIDAAHRYSAMAGVALFIAADALARGGLAAFIFSNRERWLTSIRRLRAAELERACIERDLAQSRLVAMEVRLQPAVLLSTLETLGALYECDRAQGDRSLAEFIEHLRSLTASIHV